MVRYSEERREALVRRMLSGGVTIAALARESGITEMTLYRWRDKAKTNHSSVSKSKKSEKLSAAQKLAAVAETAGLGEEELAEYCRKSGLYPQQVKT